MGIIIGYMHSHVDKRNPANKRELTISSATSIEIINYFFYANEPPCKSHCRFF